MGKLEKEFEEETGKEALIAVIGHGEKAYASWDYQQWLEKRIKALEQSPERVSVDAVVSDKLVDEFGFEVQGLSDDLSDLDWNKALIRHAKWIKEQAENVADNLLNENLR